MMEIVIRKIKKLCQSFADFDRILYFCRKFII